MKKMFFALAALVAIVSGVIVINGCGSSPETGTRTRPAFFEGDGGKGMRIAVLAPEGRNLPGDQQWLLAQVQGSLTGDFQKYSAMTVCDRQNMEKVLDEQLNSETGYYSEEDYPEIGKLLTAQYILSGVVTKTSSAYTLEFAVTDAESGVRMASYSPQSCTLETIETLIAVKDASIDLLEQLGVKLTDAGKTSLRNVSTSQANAEAALAKGITAQRSGTIVEALSYYYEAASFDSSLLEAANRASVTSAAISSGNIGENVRNDIQRRKEWQKILAEAEDYFSKHPPFEIIYDATLTQGRVDYQRETVNLSTSVSLDASKDGFKIFETILKGLESTGQRREWGFGFWPLSSKVFSDVVYSENRSEFTRAVWSVDIGIGLFNDRGDCVSKGDIKLTEMVHFAQGKKLKSDSFDYGYIIWSRVDGDIYLVDTTKLVTNGILAGGPVFLNVNANDITDAMTVKVISVNGIDAERAVRDGYIRITTGAIAPGSWADDLYLLNGWL
jgi:TolB-like protein